MNEKLIVLNKVCRRAGAFLLAAATAASLTACGAAAKTGPDSPRLQDCVLRGETVGGETDQYIVADLNFDREISLGEGLEDQLRVVIGGERVDPEDISPELKDSETLELRMHVDRVVTGALEITAAPGEDSISAIRSAEGDSCVAGIEVKKMIPSGVRLSEVSSGAGTVTCRVDSVPDHRCIVWLQILVDGEPAAPDINDKTDILDNAVAVHQHDFLWATEKSVTEDMADSLNRYFSSGFTATASDGTVTVTKKGDSDGSEIELRIYE